jgi:predicted nucleic acid-binding protein
MSDYVFDTEPLIAYLYDEPGVEMVADLLGAIKSDEATAAISETTATEITYLVARFEGDGQPTSETLATGRRDVLALQRHGVTLVQPSWETVAEIKASGNIALGDAYAVALAAERDATLVVGADDDFDSLPLAVDLKTIRDDGV